jgi:hypothetical protein
MLYILNRDPQSWSLSSISILIPIPTLDLDPDLDSYSRSWSQSLPSIPTLIWCPIFYLNPYPRRGLDPCPRSRSPSPIFNLDPCLRFSSSILILNSDSHPRSWSRSRYRSLFSILISIPIPILNLNHLSSVSIPTPIPILDLNAYPSLFLQFIFPSSILIPMLNLAIPILIFKFNSYSWFQTFILFPVFI